MLEIWGCSLSTSAAYTQVFTVFMPKNINCVTIIITLEGIGKDIKQKKCQQNSLKNISFTNAVGKCQQTMLWFLDFEWLLTLYNYLILTFHWFISAS